MTLEKIRKLVDDSVIRNVCRDNSITEAQLLDDRGGAASVARAQLWQSMREAGHSFAEIAEVSGRSCSSSVYSALQRYYPEAYPRRAGKRGRRPAS